jgi:hypothetical protein
VEEMHESPLIEEELRAIADFARFVDKCMAARDMVVSCSSPNQVAKVARYYGYTKVTAELLEIARNKLNWTDWIWQKIGREWRDYVYILSLLSLSDEGLLDRKIDHASSQYTDTRWNVYSRFEIDTFYEYAKTTKEMQKELRASRSIEGVAKVAEAHGFYIKSIDILMNKHEWRDEFFPWAGMSIQESREFMHSPRTIRQDHEETL